jgi:putative ATP-dependent endonuclease of OLD family
MASLFRTLGKSTVALCDKQDAINQAAIEAEVELLLMHEENGFEELVLKGTTMAALERFAAVLEWPTHLLKDFPDPAVQAYESVGAYFSWAKGNWAIADFLAQCSEEEIPEWLRDSCQKLKEAF